MPGVLVDTMEGLRADIRNEAIGELVQRLLASQAKYGKVKEEDLLKRLTELQVPNQYKRPLLTAAKNKFQDAFGLKIIEHADRQRNRTVYYMKTAQLEPDVRRFGPKWSEKELANNGLLMTILAYIFMMDPRQMVVTETQLWKFLRGLGIERNWKTSHPAFGELKQVLSHQVTQPGEFVKHGWLQAARIANSDPPLLEFRWGPRAHAIIDKDVSGREQKTPHPAFGELKQVLSHQVTQPGEFVKHGWLQAARIANSDPPLLEFRWGPRAHAIIDKDVSGREQKTPHPAFGELKQVLSHQVTQPGEFVKDGWLQAKRIANSDPPLLEFRWGPRAHAIIDKDVSGREQKTPHPAFGELKQVLSHQVTQPGEFVKDGWLQAKRIANSDPPLLEFRWGPRAHAIIDKDVSGRKQKTPHPAFGELKQVLSHQVTQPGEFVKDGWLQAKRIANSDPPLLEFRWGPRAHAIIDKGLMLNFVCTAYGNERRPQDFQTHHEIVTKERAQAQR